MNLDISDRLWFTSSILVFSLVLFNFSIFFHFTIFPYFALVKPHSCSVKQQLTRTLPFIIHENWLSRIHWPVRVIRISYPHLGIWLSTAVQIRKISFALYICRFIQSIHSLQRLWMTKSCCYLSTVNIHIAQVTFVFRYLSPSSFSTNPLYLI